MHSKFKCILLVTGFFAHMHLVNIWDSCVHKANMHMVIMYVPNAFGLYVGNDIHMHLGNTVLTHMHLVNMVLTICI
jgi:hypothetical protein